MKVSKGETGVSEYGKTVDGLCGKISEGDLRFTYDIINVLQSITALKETNFEDKVLCEALKKLTKWGTQP